ncbi:MAG: response regulator transcription factor [Planctomycetes bacterium]|nr:response regulator transcription factor [Planctomycetota bacterium]
MRVLLVEDDPRVSSFVERGLAQLGFLVDIAADGARGLERALSGTPEVVILDLMLPGIDGHAVVAELRRRGRSVPVLVLSACDGVGDRVRALDGGADDFLVKPFSFDELVARVRALARRPKGITASLVQVGDLCMDLAKRSVERGGRSLPLTAKEFALLEFLVRHKDAVVTRTMIAEQVWGQHFGSFSNVIDVYIRYLRAKVDDPSEVKLIHTVRGVGYVLSETRA